MRSNGEEPIRHQPPSLTHLRHLGTGAGLSAVGVTSADILEPARTILPNRRAAGLSATMQFTYRNPERSTDPRRSLPGAESLLVGLLDYRQNPPPEPGYAAGRVARYATGDYYGRLRAGLGVLAEALHESGHKTIVMADSNALVDRNAAWRAGLGWYGKNTNLLVEGAGSWFVVGAVVTDAVWPHESTPVEDGCGSCSACLDGCPTGALVAPGVLDARRCIAWLVQAAEPIPVQFREAVGDRIYGCDICQEVCPPNKVSIRTSPPVADTIGDASWVDVAWILAAADAELLERHGRWYIANRDPDVIRRTALVVLGNVGDPDRGEVRSLLGRYINHERPLLRAHAVWAARRLGLDHLAVKTRDDQDPAVRGEWSAPVTARFPA